MTNKTAAKIENEDAGLTDERVEAILDNAAAQTNPAETGIAHLRAGDETALRLWSVKGPKGTNSTISAVLLDGPKIVMLHQFSGGKYRVFEPSDV